MLSSEMCININKDTTLYTLHFADNQVIIQRRSGYLDPDI